MRMPMLLTSYVHSTYSTSHSRSQRIFSRETLDFWGTKSLVETPAVTEPDRKPTRKN